jgi:Na+/H+ antiporter NhaA
MERLWRIYRTVCTPGGSRFPAGLRVTFQPDLPEVTTGTDVADMDTAGMDTDTADTAMVGMVAGMDMVSVLDKVFLMMLILIDDIIAMMKPSEL